MGQMIPIQTSSDWKSCLPARAPKRPAVRNWEIRNIHSMREDLKDLDLLVKQAEIAIMRRMLDGEQVEEGEFKARLEEPRHGKSRELRLAIEPPADWIQDDDD